MPTLEAIDGTIIEIDDVHTISGVVRGSLVLQRIFHGDIPHEMRDIDQEVMARLQCRGVRDIEACKIMHQIVQLELVIFRYVHQLDPKYHDVSCGATERVVGSVTYPHTNPVGLDASRSALYDRLPEHYHVRLKETILAVISECQLVEDSPDSTIGGEE